MKTVYEAIQRRKCRGQTIDYCSGFRTVVMTNKVVFIGRPYPSYNEVRFSNR